jgi:hypothetical protein
MKYKNRWTSLVVKSLLTSATFLGLFHILKQVTSGSGQRQFISLQMACFQRTM